MMTNLVVLVNDPNTLPVRQLDAANVGSRSCWRSGGLSSILAAVTAICFVGTAIAFAKDENTIGLSLGGVCIGSAAGYFRETIAAAFARCCTRS